MEPDSAIRRRDAVDWRRAEFVLAGLAILSFALIPLHILKAYEGLPAHPLFIHVPVILIPLSVLGSLTLVIKRGWWERYGVLLASVAVVAMASVFLAMGAGEALRTALHLSGSFGPAALIARHASAADKLRITYIVFTAVVLLALAAHRIAAGKPTGLVALDKTLGTPSAVLVLRVALVLLAIGNAYMVWKVGDLGAKAVWENRLSGGGFGGGAGGPASSGGAGSLFGSP
jgi:hypothetical protein